MYDWNIYSDTILWKLSSENFICVPSTRNRLKMNFHKTEIRFSLKLKLTRTLQKLPDVKFFIDIKFAISSDVPENVLIWNAWNFWIEIDEIRLWSESSFQFCETKNKYNLQNFRIELHNLVSKCERWSKVGKKSSICIYFSKFKFRVPAVFFKGNSFFQTYMRKILKNMNLYFCFRPFAFMSLTDETQFLFQLK